MSPETTYWGGAKKTRSPGSLFCSSWLQIEGKRSRAIWSHIMVPQGLKMHENMHLINAIKKGKSTSAKIFRFFGTPETGHQYNTVCTEEDSYVYHASL